MVVLINLPTTEQSLDAVSVDSVDISSVTSEGIENVVSEMLTAQASHPSRKRNKSNSPPKSNIRESLMNSDIRDSRETGLRGKVGNRRRKRYENANFLNVPNSQPPLPSDWEVYPTYPVYQNVPYYLAPLWDDKFQRIAEERIRTKSSTLSHGKVSQDLKLALKKAKSARYVLQHFEDEIRKFIHQANVEHATKATCWSQEEMDTDDEEIVFIGRDQDGKIITMSDEADLAFKQEPAQFEKLVFETKPQDGGGFMRWLIHELADYYGLKSYSEHRESVDGNKKYVQITLVGFWDQGIKGYSKYAGKPPVNSGVFKMPRPLWCLV